MSTDDRRVRRRRGPRRRSAQCGTLRSTLVVVGDAVDGPGVERRGVEDLLEEDDAHCRGEDDANVTRLHHFVRARRRRWASRYELWYTQAGGQRRPAKPCEAPQ
eukprot:CAMPEP_0184106840 /NCGR_PEP_ID=MMETSP0974-20121125/15578_1 /TAXON_ID=483370 /ORGANISM="non described non described, Strain CCMP2097" /LENGTH=103 /DNA_ID=CAMNT_0026409857 /DNA_START=1 /DNA_END=312 /DNA_ORIENTATION=+